MKKQPSSQFRNVKIAARMQQELGEIIHEYVRDLNGLVTISKVEVSGDNRWAKVWISILNIEDQQVIDILQANIYEIQGEVYRRLSMKLAPRIQFYLDTAPRYAQHIDDVIKKIHTEEDGQ